MLYSLYLEYKEYNIITESTFTTQRLDHLGIVAGVCDRIDLINTIDNFIPPTKRKVSVGEAVAAMILNALGFVSRPLYLTPEFFSNKPVDLLIRPHLCAADFTDDSLGRALDTLYENGVTELFATVASKALSTFDIDHRFVHLDSTTFSFHGNYDTETDDENAIEITHGYSRDQRPDLKQAVVQLICSYRSQFPVWFEALNGNQVDKTSFPETIREYLSQMDGNDTPYFVADSALYTAHNIASLSDVRFITRVPETLKAVKELYQTISTQDMQPAPLDGYRYLSVDSTYGNVPQRWLVVYSEAAYHREVATLEKKIAKAQTSAETSLKRLENKTYDTYSAAENAVSEISKSWKYHQPDISIISVPHYTTSGRPKKTDKPTHFRYRIEGKVVADIETIEHLKRSKGRFVLATNELETTLLDDATLLEVYKAQNISVERGFRFLKDPLFFAHSLFLEKPQRIMALLMVMGLSLLVYALAEKWVRSGLVEQDETIPNQVGKPTQNPTLRRIFQMFEGIDVLVIKQNEHIQRTIVNLNEIHSKIINILGIEVKNVYFPDS